MGIFSRRRGNDQRSAEYVFPMDRTQERIFDDNFVGDIFFWDIDKTYLASEFDSLRGLLSVPLELAIDKRNVRGTDILLRGLRRGRSVSGALSSHPIYFVSASPPQLRTVLQKKMILDGVEYDGMAFKDQLALVRSGRFSELRNHVGYKLTALLAYRSELPWNAQEYLFGDDSEADVLIYSLYTDIVAGRLRGQHLKKTLNKHHVDPRDVDFLEQLATPLPHKDLVRRIYIHLDRKTPPHHFDHWGPCIIPCRNAFQMALQLFEDERIHFDCLKQMASALMADASFSPSDLAANACELYRRRHLNPQTIQSVLQRLELPSPQPPIESRADGQRAPEDEERENETKSRFVTPEEFLA